MRLLYAILSGGLAAGLMDFFAAVAMSRTNPTVIGKAVASGLYGKAAFKAGDGVAALGVGLHFAMSLIIAAIYVLAADRIAVLRQHALVFGLAYGVAVFVVMDYVVRPLSRAGLPHFTPTSFAEQFAAMLIFGLFVAFADRYFAPK